MDDTLSISLAYLCLFLQAPHFSTGLHLGAGLPTACCANCAAKAEAAVNYF